MSYAATCAGQAQTDLTGSGDETAVLVRMVREHRHVVIPGGMKITISGPVAVPEDTTIQGPGSIRLIGRGAGLTLGRGCVVRDVRFVSEPQFAHGSAIRMATENRGRVRRMDVRVVGCTFARMHGQALLADEVSHVTFESNRWENHSDSSLFYNAVVLRAVQNCIIRGNTILHPNQGILFHGGTHNIVSGNYIENCLQGITCHTQAGHPEHWPYTLFAHNTITGNVVRRFREEGITYDNSMGETPAVKAAQNQIRAVATVGSVSAPPDGGRIRIVLAESANPDKAYSPGWADRYYVAILDGQASASLLEVIASGGDGQAGWIDLPRVGPDLHARLAKGDRLWIGAGCFMNTISGNSLANENMISGTGNATAIGLWGASWNNVITGNICSSRQYGITIGCVGLARPESPQGPSGGNQVSHNTIVATWSSEKPRPQDNSAGIGFVYIGDGPLLGGRLFLANSIAHNTISWPGARPISLARDTGTAVEFNRIAGGGVAIYMDHTTGAVLNGNRGPAGTLIRDVRQVGPSTFQLLPPEQAQER